MVRKCFYSFHYKPDCVRASQVRNIGSVEGNPPAKDNDWETITKGGDQAIAKWIDDQMKGKTCIVVLVGQNTANRKWINHEIVKAWDSGLGVVGIRIHGLKNFEGQTATAGANPFDFITHGASQKKLSEIVKCYDPVGLDSKAKYAWIAESLAAKIEEAIAIRGKYSA
ncbi:TIR domain-containing protein [Azonexus sp.]|uniref:TIR domain-containing protein n=1 Tax=Azonexus sp. TaxID=1872668 RepID=UPI0035B4CBE3